MISLFNRFLYEVRKGEKHAWNFPAVKKLQILDAGQQLLLPQEALSLNVTWTLVHTVRDQLMAMGIKGNQLG